MADDWSTAESDWQGVDDEPVADSENLIKSGSVYDYLAKKIVDQDTASKEKNYLIRNNGNIESANFYSIVRPIQLKKGDTIKVKNGEDLYIPNNAAALFVCTSEGTYQSTILSGRGSGGNIAIVYTATTDMYIGFCCGTADATYTVYRLTEAAPNDDFETIKNTVDGHSDAISTLDSDDKLFISSDIYQKITFESSKVIEIPQAGQQVSLTPMSASAAWSCGYAECKEGDKVFLNVLGGVGTSRAWGFLDKDLTVLNRANQSESVENETLTAPQKTAYIVVNTVNTINDYKAYVVPIVAKRVNDLEETVTDLVVIPSSIKVVRGCWGETEKWSNYVDYWLCTDRIVYCLAGSYILNPSGVDGMRVYKRKFNDNNPKSGSTETWSAATVISITESGWYAFSMRKTDYSTINLSEFPASNFHCTLDADHKEEPYMTVNFIGGSNANYPLGGDNTLFTTPNGKKLAVDTGAGISVPVCKSQYYKNGGLKLDYIVISHYHNDHIGGLVYGLEQGWLEIEGATLFLPDQGAFEYALQNNLVDATSVDYYNRLQTALESINVTKIYPSENMQPYYIDDDVYLAFFNTSQSYLEGETDDYNNFSLGCYVVYGNTKICMTGDMSLLAEQHCADVMLKADIMKAAHHGFDGSPLWLDPYFINSIYPDFIIAEDGTIHEERLQDPELINRFAQLTWCKNNCIPYYRTYKLGVIDVTVTKQHYTIDSHTHAYSTDEDNPVFEKAPLYDLSVFKKVGACGDSYTRGSLYKTNGTWAGYRTDLAWQNVLARKHGFNCQTFAFGGVSTAGYINNPICLPKLLSSERCDLYFLFLGINDAIAYESDSSYLGTIADIHVGSPSQNPNTFYGNYAKIIEAIQEYAPASLQIMMTVKFIYAAEDYIKQINIAIKAIAALYEIPCMDLYNTPAYNSSIFTGSLQSGHPTAILHSAIAKQIDNSFYGCVLDNIAYFNKYAIEHLTNGTFANRPAADSVDAGSTYWDETNNVVWETDGVKWTRLYEVKREGTSSDRPSNAPIGTCYYDETIGKPIWWNGTVWIDATGTSV